MGKVFFKIIEEFVDITGYADIDGVLVAIIGTIAFAVAFDWVGKLFDAIGWYDSNLMSDVHWLIRTGILLGLAYVIKKFIEFVTWIFSFQWWVYLISFSVVVFAILGVYFLRYQHQKKKNFQSKSEEHDFTDVPMVTEEKGDTYAEKEKMLKPVMTYDKQRCPRCNSKLVKRYGPYGTFYGCEAYGRIGCRYTRKKL